MHQSIPLLPVEQAIMRAAVEPCTALIRECNAGIPVVSPEACLGAYIVCNYGEQIPYQLSGYNPYDMRIKCEVPPLIYVPFSTFISYNVYPLLDTYYTKTKQIYYTKTIYNQVHY